MIRYIPSKIFGWEVLQFSSLLICKFVNVILFPSSLKLFTHFCQQSSRHSSHVLILSQKLLLYISRKLFNNIQIICLLCLRKVFWSPQLNYWVGKLTMVKTSMSPPRMNECIPFMNECIKKKGEKKEKTKKIKATAISHHR